MIKQCILFFILIIGCTPQLALTNSEVMLNSSDKFVLETNVVSKVINGSHVEMFGYNGEIPGPTLRVKQNSDISVLLKNGLDVPTTIHWHGVSVENKFDGVPHVTQSPVLPRESYEYKLRFPDDGFYWYHSHFREDMQQDRGLYGAIVVEPLVPYSSILKEHVLLFDDVLLEDGVIKFGENVDRVVMGRFGNVFLTNGMENFQLNIKSPARLFLVNAANTRIFNISIGVPFTVIGGDSGIFERSFVMDSLVIAPGERFIVDVIFNASGIYYLQHINPFRKVILGSLNVSGSNYSMPNYPINSEFNFSRFWRNKSPDFVFDLFVRMPEMHISALTNASSIEWEDDGIMNVLSNSKNTEWIIRDRSSGEENMDVNLSVKLGEVKIIRLFNGKNQMHAMQHPMHLHGQRFLILGVDSVPNNNFVWKDTVLVPAGSVVDILVNFSNPGSWAFHCHIAEHAESGMMSFFNVE